MGRSVEQRMQRPLVAGVYGRGAYTRGSREGRQRLNERYGCGLGESDESREREARLGKWAKRKKCDGGGEEG